MRGKEQENADETDDQTHPIVHDGPPDPVVPGAVVQILIFGHSIVYFSGRERYGNQFGIWSMVHGLWQMVYRESHLADHLSWLLFDNCLSHKP